MINFLAATGRLFFSLLNLVGKIVIGFGRTLIAIITPPYYFKVLSVELLEVGFFSLPIVFLTSLFAGMVLALQSYTSFAAIPSESIIANVVAVALVRELAPVLVSLMVAGRISSSICAQIGSMKVTEQINALKIMSVRPIKYLVAPKIVAGIICLPILVIMADLIGIMGGYIVAVSKLHFNGTSYIIDSYCFVTAYDLLSGVVKSIVFGFILTTFGCWYGFNCKNSAHGVGQATTNAVVSASICIFIADYLLTMIFFGVR